MKMNDLQNDWQNQPIPALGGSKAINDIVRTSKRAARFRAGVLATCAFNVVASLAFTWHVLATRGGHLIEEAWPAFLIQCLSLSVVVAIFRHRARLRRQWINCAETVRASLERCRAEASADIREHGLIVCFIALAAPLLWYAALQLRSSGKMNDAALNSFTILCTLVVIVNAAIYAWRRHYRLTPRRAKAEEILASLSE